MLRVNHLLSVLKLSTLQRGSIARPGQAVQEDFMRRLGVQLSFSGQHFLRYYPRKHYESFYVRLRTFKRVSDFETLLVAPPSKIANFDFFALTDQFLRTCLQGTTLDLTDLQVKYSRFLKGRLALPPPAVSLPIPGEPHPERMQPLVPLVPKVSRVLTEDLLFNHQSGIGYPRSAEEYHNLMRGILDGRGRFPGDQEGLTPQGTYSRRGAGARHFSLNRRGVKFQGEVFSPHLHAQGVRNRLIFDVDLMSQGASSDAYKTVGVSYDREYYYERRLYDAGKVPLLRFSGWPVSFAALQGYLTSFGGRDLYYAFIHFVMTRGLFQGYGLTSFSIREGMSSLFYSDLWLDRPNLMFDARGELTDYRFRMWAAAHSGRLAPFYAFVRAFQGIDPCWQPIAQAIFEDVHGRITPAAELETRGGPYSQKVVRFPDGNFPIAVDAGVYPPHNRYPVEEGRVVLPQSEVDLPSSVRGTWFGAMGGDKGVEEGNALYFGGLVTFGKIRAAKKREQQREGLGMLGGLGDHVRSWLVRRS